MPKAGPSKKAQLSSAAFAAPVDEEQTPERYARDLKVLARLKEREARMQPYSKSTARRQKRKDKSALTADLGDFGDALDAIDQPSFSSAAADFTAAAESSAHPAATAASLQEDGQPGKSGGQHGAHPPGKKLTEAKRKKELDQARDRLPQLMKHQQFKANPFAAIREHANNTMQQQQQQR